MTVADLTSVLVETLEAVLGVSGATPETSFFSAGGTSLHAEIYARTASAATGRTITFTDIFRHPSPQDLADALTTRADGADTTGTAEAEASTRWRPVSENQASRLERLRLAEQSGRPAFRAHAELLLAGFDLRGPLDVDALDAAVHAVVTRHSALRTRFRISDEGYAQQVEPASYGLEPVDARHLHPAEVLDLAWRPLDLRSGRLARFLLADFGEDHHQLWVTVEHIVSDGVSCHVLNNALADEYSRRATGTAEPAPAPAPTPVPAPAPSGDIEGHDFARLENALCQDAQGRAAEEHWRRQIGDGPIWRPYAHPDLAGPGQDRAAGDVLLVRTRPAATGRALRERAAQYGTTLHALVVFALTRAAARAAATRDVTVYWYTANRNLPGVATTVGSLAGLTMARVAPVPHGRGEAEIRAVARTVADSMAYAFHPIERIARQHTTQWLMPDDEPFLVLHVNEDTQTPEPSGAREPLRFAGLHVAAADGYGRRDRRGYTLDASVTSLPSGFSLGLSYRDGMIPAAAAARLLEGFAEEIDRIVEGAP
ncbi:condensation domain-containing protein [Kitasatospora misakiensis]|uniref:Condensation domain-containing protein n=1 Tax=Kitasatospora misakiensis TaxID=67330 RepID=A0ABW0X6A0_9ACTN